MDICDFVVCRIFSENGLWQWYEKPGYSGPAIPAWSEQSWDRFERWLNHREDENSGSEWCGKALRILS